MEARGYVHKYGNDVDTDVIIPARYLNTSDPHELAAKCMIDIDANFVNKVKPGDIMVAGDNFGCGSSREHAPRIFYRNAINIGLPIIECAEAAEAINNGDEVEIDFDTGIIKDLTTGESFTGQAFPDFIKKIIKQGGLINYINAEK